MNARAEHAVLTDFIRRNLMVAVSGLAIAAAVHVLLLADGTYQCRTVPEHIRVAFERK